MSLWYRFSYRVGLTPWDELPHLPAGRQAHERIDQAARTRPEGPATALDLGCGRGYWSVYLAERGWRVVGVEFEPKAAAAARERVHEAQVDATVLEGDVTKLDALDLPDEVDLVLDFGTVHGLTPEQREVVGRGLDGVTAQGATMLSYAFKPARRGPLPRGASLADMQAAFKSWTVTDEGPLETNDMPLPVRRAAPRWFRLMRR